MAILGSLLKRGIRLRKMVEQDHVQPFALQNDELRELVTKAHLTSFGLEYGFEQMLLAAGMYHVGKVTLGPTPPTEQLYRAFCARVPVSNYNQIFKAWWHRTKAGEANVCWPGQTHYFALSSGTSEAATKHIPITRDMVKAIRRTSIRQILSLANCPDLPGKVYQKGILMLGGSTHLNFNGTYFEGDLSGISASRLPFWFQHFYKPGRKIAQRRDWNQKLDEITRRARDWDIGVIVGVPAWIQLLMERIIDYYQVATIHDVWPNLQVYCHGGVAFEPYRLGFEKLLAHPILYLETYLASEGFIAYQDRPDTRAMRMVLNNGIFYEFIPFTSDNFDADGEVVANPATCMIHEVEEGRDYALLLSTCAGAWRYLIGDVIRFVDKQRAEIVITGRTKHFLSLCGEHLSVDNMNRAIELVSYELGITIREFAVAGIPYQSLFAHQWYIGSDDEVDTGHLRDRLDATLQELNDDYRVERIAALKAVFVKVLPSETFYKWMKLRGKEGGQNKFPRVLNKALYEEWEHYINAEVPVAG